MNIAIQGHPTRGKEVIQILESLGGKNIHGFCGGGKDPVYHYHIDDCGIIRFSSKYDLCNYKFYTLAGFKKEFPFKVGDIVLIKGVNGLYEIIALKQYMNKPCYKLNNGLHYDSKNLTHYKEIEKRNITLTLEKAKEWYKKGGELKEVALQAYSEEELSKTKLPKTFEEFCDMYPVKGTEAMIAYDAKIIDCTSLQGKREYEFKDIMPSKKSAEAHLALMQLEQLRDCYRQGWKPDYDDIKQTKYHISYCREKLEVVPAFNVRYFLTFPTKKMAVEFLKCFRDLIEIAGDLI